MLTDTHCHLFYDDLKDNLPDILDRAKQLGTSSYESGSGVTTDSSDNVYVTGTTSGGLAGRKNYGKKDIFIIKYNSSGTLQ